LGEALLVFRNGQYIPIPSEGGHVDFAPSTEAEIRLWRFLQEKFGHVSTERVLSGPGLVNLYEWLRDGEGYEEPGWLKKRFEKGDPARVVTQTALKERHPLCREALRVFVSVLGRAAGNLALTGTATGGVYLGGGIPPKILPALRQGPFMKAFVDKGRFEDYLKKIPVRVIMNDKAALLGAAIGAFDLL
jgi:glucokinase